MENIKQKSKVWGIRIGLVALFIAGFMSHDPVTHTALAVKEFVSPAPVAHVYKLSAHDQAVKDDMARPESIANCRDYSEKRVSLQEAKTLVTGASDAYSKAMQAEVRISARADETSTLMNDTNLNMGVSIRDAAKTVKAEAKTK